MAKYWEYFSNQWENKASSVFLLKLFYFILFKKMVQTRPVFSSSISY